MTTATTTPNRVKKNSKTPSKNINRSFIGEYMMNNDVNPLGHVNYVNGVPVDSPQPIPKKTGRN